MDLQTRKRVGTLIRIGLIIGTLVYVVGFWIAKRVPRPPEHVSVQRDAPPATSLGPGDLQIISTNGTVDLILKGDKIMGGLSPATVAKVRAEMEKQAGKDSTGFGGMIAGMVKSSVASAIGTHITYPVGEVTEVRFDDGRLVIKTKTGGEKENSFGDIKVDDKKESARFSKEDGDRFIAAFKARKKELGLP